MRDGTLSVEQYLPPPRDNETAYIDLHVDGDSYENIWRKGRIRATIPALPNNTNPALSITLTMQVQPAGGGAAANTQPLIQAVIPGVAVNGSAALTVDFPLPPADLTGPIQFQQTVPAGAGNNIAGLIVYDWLNE